MIVYAILGDMTKFYIIRHCEARGNSERIFQGVYDCELSETGILQAEYISLRMRNERIDRIFSSSRKRAQATAKAVNKYHMLPIETDDSVIEINAGDWEGKRFADFQRLFPEESRLWNTQPYNFEAPHGEKMSDVYKRTVEFIKRTAAENNNKNIAVISHGCAIRNMLCWAKGLEFDKLGSVGWCANTGVNIIEVSESGEPRLILENDITHLPPELRSVSAQKWWNEDDDGVLKEQI